MLRHQWYQLGNKVVIDVYAKNLPEDAVAVQLTGTDNDKLHICIAAQQPSSSSGAQQPPAAADGEDYVLELDLFEKVSTEVPIKVEVLRTKVELTLVKANNAIHWNSLEKGAKGPVAAGVAAAAVAPQETTNVRQYPSSKGPKDWSKVEGTLSQPTTDIGCDWWWRARMCHVFRAAVSCIAVQSSAKTLPLLSTACMTCNKQPTSAVFVSGLAYPAKF